MFSSIKHHYEFHQSAYLNCINYLLQLHISVYQWPEMELLAKTQQHSNLNLQLQSWIFEFYRAQNNIKFRKYLIQQEY